jgi:hypothetical protein
MSELATAKFGQTIYEIDGAVLESFMLSTAPVQIICGPVGSGKPVPAQAFRADGQRECCGGATSAAGDGYAGN